MFATVISLCPIEIKSNFPHTIPAYVTMPPGSIDNPSLCVMTDGEVSQYVGLQVNAKNPWITYPVSAVDMAKNFVEDFKRSAPWAKPQYHPGVFFVEGKPDSVEKLDRYELRYTFDTDFVAKFPEQFKEAKDKQYEWFKVLCGEADRSFAKRSNHAEITNVQRYAAKVLNLDRPWAKEIKPEHFIQCIFCRQMIEPEAIICLHCNQIVDQERFDEIKSRGKSKEVASFGV